MGRRSSKVGHEVLSCLPRAAPLAVRLFHPQATNKNPGAVFDSRPRVISNLVGDRTSTNPAAVAHASLRAPTQGNQGVVPLHHRSRLQH